MKRSSRVILFSFGLACVVAAVALAAPPSATSDTLFYSGTIEGIGGSTANFVVQLVRGADVLCTSTTDNVPLSEGTFRIALDSACNDVVTAGENVAVRTRVNGQRLEPDVPLGAVPVALVAKTVRPHLATLVLQDSMQLDSGNESFRTSTITFQGIEDVDSEFFSVVADDTDQFIEARREGRFTVRLQVTGGARSSEVQRFAYSVRKNGSHDFNSPVATGDPIIAGSMGLVDLATIGKTTGFIEKNVRLNVGDRIRASVEKAAPPNATVEAPGSETFLQVEFVGE